MKQVQQSDDASSSSSDEEKDNGAHFKKIDDMDLLIRKYHKGLKQNGYLYKVVQRRFSNKKRELAKTMAAPNTLLPNVLMRRKKTTTRGTTTKKASMSIERETSKWERHTLGMSGTQLKSQVMRM
jgi:hypothetical protein